jgi:hypothetical protein
MREILDTAQAYPYRSKKALTNLARQSLSDIYLFKVYIFWPLARLYDLVVYR